MQIILRDDVDKVGLRGEVVTVADGFARNFLIPRGLAERATPAKVAEVRKRDEHRARHEARSFEQAQDIAERLGKTVLRFDVQAGPTGTLFGSVTPTNVADELWRTRKVRVDRRKIALDEPIKRIGRYSIPIEVFQDVTVEVKTLVVPEGGELPPEEELAALAAAEEEAAAAEAREAAEAAEAEALATEEALALEEEEVEAEAEEAAAPEETEPEEPA
jgi:large subunit ribosomal protein L9